jgi:hypothetical protein
MTFFDRRFLMLATLACAACVSTPRNKTKLADTEEVIPFSGYTYILDRDVVIQVLDHEDNKWKHQGHTRPDRNAYLTDENGWKWYRWEINLRAPVWHIFHSGKEYWRKGPSRTMQVKFRVVQFLSDGTPQTLFTYEADADTCFNANGDKPTLTRLSECRSPESPILTLSAPCGRKGQKCCNEEGNLCNTGLACASSDDGRCVDCGAQGERCCDGACDHGGLTCNNQNRCEQCGGQGGPCCANNSCDGGNICTGGRCESCGGPGERCCSGGICDSGSVCNSGRCELCGSRGERCCGHDRCEGSLTCSNNRCGDPPPPPECPIQSTGICGIGCPEGYHPVAYVYSIGCGGSDGLSRNSTACRRNCGSSFPACGSTCPAGYQPTSYTHSIDCRLSGSGGGLEDNSVTCRAL